MCCLPLFLSLPVSLPQHIFSISSQHLLTEHFKSKFDVIEVTLLEHLACFVNQNLLLAGTTEGKKNSHELTHPSFK